MRARVVVHRPDSPMKPASFLSISDLAIPTPSDEKKGGDSGIMEHQNQPVHRRSQTRRADVEMREADEGEGELRTDAEDEERAIGEDDEKVPRMDGGQTDSKLTRSAADGGAFQRSQSKKCTFCSLMFNSEEK